MSQSKAMTLYHLRERVAGLEAEIKQLKKALVATNKIAIESRRANEMALEGFRSLTAGRAPDLADVLAELTSDWG